MRLPVASRKAPIISSLMKQKPVSSAEVMVPRKARLNSETLTITTLPGSLALNEAGAGCDIFPSRVRPGAGLNNCIRGFGVTGVIGSASGRSSAFGVQRLEFSQGLVCDVVELCTWKSSVTSVTLKGFVLKITFEDRSKTESKERNDGASAARL